MPDFTTALPEIAWPAVPKTSTAGVLALLFELECSQWESAERLRSQQFRQLANVVRHAYQTVPYYQRTFDAAKLDLTTVALADSWHEIPLLTRRDIQSSGNQLHSTNLPKAHGTVASTATSGSTNAPVVTLGTSLTEFFWRVLTLRDHFWHRRDFSQSFAAIRYTGDQSALPPDGARSDNWGPATLGVVATGPAFVLNIQSTIEEQAHWLVRANPGYVLGYPSALLAIARLFEERDWRLPQLRELRTFGEILEPECRSTCQRLFGVPVVDMYTSQEVGYIALQCPQHEHYHVQSENLFVEILDDAGRACRPGEIGRVVVTTLHNFAMPLVRYDIGDYAEVGEPCPCGRGLPVLKRILGRQRNLLVLPDGRRRWPIFDAGERPDELPLFSQFQVIQRSLDEIEVLAVRPQSFAPCEEEHLKRYMQQTLGHPFKIAIRCVESIPRSRTGKFEDFICDVQ
jgi:phenylacetate-CoA ligase